MRLRIEIEAEANSDIEKVVKALQGLTGTTSTVKTTNLPEEPHTPKTTSGSGKKERKEKPATKPEKKQESVVVETETKETEPTMSVPEMQRKLAELKTTKGLKAADIKQVIANYGAQKLSGIDPSKYQDILNDVEAL